MAIVFEMWAECSSEDECHSLAHHFNDLRHDLLTGRTVTWQAEIAASPVGVLVWSRDLSRYGVRSVQDAVESTEAGLRLYAHLRAGPAFQFARVAWEAELITLSELGDWVSPFGQAECRLDVECAVAEAVYRQLGSPKFCHEFRSGYWWTRYSGEEYRPLHSNDQGSLNDLCRALFPEYFAY